MTRLGKLDVDQLDDDQRALYASIAQGPRAQGPQLFALTDDAGRLEGPFNAMLLSPALGAALQAVGSAVRYASGLPGRAREIAILIVAHHWRSEFEIYAHEAAGAASGLSELELAALRSGHLDVLDDDSERLVATTAQALAVRGDLDDDEYAEASSRLGAQQLFELTTLVGYYATLALQLRVYRVTVPEQPEQPEQP
jgi:4-carboxymuconolactone decarboxylase